MKLEKARVLIVGGNNTAGPLPDLMRFLAEGRRAGEVSFIGHPFAEDLVRRSRLVHRNGDEARERSVGRERSRGVVSYCWDLVLTAYFLLRLRRRHDLYVSGSPHFGLLGLALKALGLVGQTVFWTHDYHPRRFRNRLLNRLYLHLDRVIAEGSDWGWDVVPSIAEHRRQRGVRLRRERLLTVGDPLESRELTWLPPEEVPGGSILFSGLVGPGYGFDLLLEAMPRVLERQRQAKVTVTTYQQFPADLRRRIQERGLEGHFDVRGFIADEDAYSRVVRRHRLGLALYEPASGSHKMYSDSRVKTYLARGLAVVMTRVSPIAAEVEKAGAGIIIGYDAGELAAAILKLLSDEEAYRRCRDNALALAQEYVSERVFGVALGRMGIE